MAIQYPTFFPHMRISGYRIQPDENVARTEMDQGAARQRRRFVDTPSRCKGSLIMNSDTMMLFESWYKHKAREGAEWIEMMLAIGEGNVTQEVRFLRPFRQKLESHDMWQVDIELELRQQEIITEEVYDLLIDQHGIDDLEAAADAAKDVAVADFDYKYPVKFIPQVRLALGWNAALPSTALTNEKPFFNKGIMTGTIVPHLGNTDWVYVNASSHLRLPNLPAGKGMTVLFAEVEAVAAGGGEHSILYAVFKHEVNGIDNNISIRYGGNYPTNTVRFVSSFGYTATSMGTVPSGHFVRLILAMNNVTGKVYAYVSQGNGTLVELDYVDVVPWGVYGMHTAYILNHHPATTHFYRRAIIAHYPTPLTNAQIQALTRDSFTA